ncbi:vWA domain-containing protein [Leptothrix sp. BB-4]
MTPSAHSTQLILTPLRAATPIEGGVTEVLIRLQAPDAPAVRAARPKLRLALVIDRSGSMEGEPLAEALRCARDLIERLQPTDEVAVVVYDNLVEVPIPLQPVASAADTAAALGNIHSRGSTALHAGWLAGLSQLGDSQPDAISRVVLLSDGQANIGPSTLEAFTADLNAARSRGLTTTTVGLGAGFNEDLMIGIARLGGGQSYYGQTAADLADPFNEEFALLEALCARHLRLHLTAAPGVQWDLLGDLTADTAAGTITLPDLAYGAEAWAVVRLHLSPATGREIDHRHLLTVRVSGTALSTEIVLDALPVRLDLPGLPAAMVDALAPDPLVVSRSSEARFAQAMSAVHVALRSGSRTAIDQALAVATELAAGQPWLEAKLASLKALADADREMASKEARYTSRKLSARLAAKEESNMAACWSDLSQLSIDPSAPADPTDPTAPMPSVPAFLRRKVSEGKR